MYLKKLVCALFVLFVLACSKETAVVEYTKTVRFAFENSEINSTPEPVTTSMSAYVFKDNLLRKSFLNLTPTASGEISMELPTGAVVYFISDTDEIPELSAIKEEASLNSFLNITYSPVKHAASRAPEFLSGIFNTSTQVNGGSVHKIPLTRSVARYDIDATHDAKITIDRAEIENCAASTLLFAGSANAVSSQKCKYEVSYNNGKSGIIEDVFRTYESGEIIKITVYGKYDNIPFVVRMEQLKVERNKIYKILVKNVGASITGIFEILPWGDGGIIEGLPDASEKIMISIPNSTIPSNVTIDGSKNEVKIPNTGTNMTLAFRADSEIEIAKIEGLISDVQIVSIGNPTSTADGVISKYSLAVAPQGNGRLSYSVVLNMKYKLQQHTYDQVRIVVEKSANQIETVELGGKTWMAFNARSRDLDDQVYLLDGATVEQMYNKNWTSVIGGLFQWGRIHMYTPWESGVHNAGNQNALMTWNSDTHVPCPEGYRVPTQAEIRDLFPDGQEIPGTFDYNGEQVDVTIHTATEPIKTPTGVSGSPRFLKFESRKTGNKLFIALSGHKGDKSGSNNPSFGQGLFLWCNDIKGAIGGWAFGAKFWPGNAASGKVDAKAQLQAEAYAYLRCIKE